MKIEVKILGYLNKNVNSRGMLQMELAEPTTGLDLVRKLQISENQSFVFMVNERRENIGINLKDGDRVTIVSLVRGG